MEKNNRKTIAIIIFVAIFVFVFFFSIYSSPYRTERIKQFMDSVVLSVVDGNRS